MIDKESLKAALEFARENGLASIEVHGIKMEVPPPSKPESPEDAKDITQPKTPYDDLDDDQVLFWSTPHFDQIEAEREMRKQQQEDDANG